jgi:hypothetical protein
MISDICYSGGILANTTSNIADLKPQHGIMGHRVGKMCAGGSLKALQADPVQLPLYGF